MDMGDRELAELLRESRQIARGGCYRSARTLAFLAEVEAVCVRHGLSIGHEDVQGGFLVVPWAEHERAWLADAVEEWPEGTEPPYGTEATRMACAARGPAA